MNIPDAYTREDASPQHKEMYEVYKLAISRIKESSKTAREIIFDSYGNTIWQEPEDDYLNRMSDLGYLVIC